MIKVCQMCGQEFVARRSTAKWCSDLCKMRWHRGSVALPGAFVRPTPPAICLTGDEVAQIVCAAHTAAQDLSRASMLTRPPLSAKLGAVSAKIEAALRGEGL